MNDMYFKKTSDRLKTCAAEVEEALKDCLIAEYLGETYVSDAMRYSTLGGGKRIRAFLVIEFCRLFGGNVQAAIPYACALECIHAYSLIHDDLPCMDNDDIRRGKPSCHVRFGEAEALLAGDGLLTLAFELCASNKYVSDASVRHAVSCLAHEAGACGMVGGQVLDIENNILSYDDLKTIYDKKTGALLRAACLLGYYAACTEPRKEDISAIKLYAESVGLAFQIHDDILDVKSNAETLGKNVGSDERNNKKTVLSFMSMEEAERQESLLTLLATEALSPYPGSETLCDLALWLLERKK